MYVYIYVCIYIYIYICVCVCVYVCMYVCIYACMYVCINPFFTSGSTFVSNRTLLKQEKTPFFTTKKPILSRDLRNLLIHNGGHDF